MASEIKSHNVPKIKLVSGLASLGYSIIQTYYEPCLFKTDAPIPIIYDLMKAWKKKLLENGDKTGDHNMKEFSVAARIMAKPYTIK